MFTVNFTHPIELVKTRMQVTGGGLGGTIGSLLKNEGALALWKGIPAAWGREASYASIKLGGYAPMRDFIAPHMGDAPGWAVKLTAGALTGGVGSFVGNPFDVLKTLAQANEGQAVGMFTLAGNMLRDQGVRGFYRGLQANVMRACVLNSTKMATYDVTKQKIVAATGWGRRDFKCIISASVIAGFVMTICVAPFDMIRTKLMNQPLDAKLYDGFVDCAVKTIKNDGALSLYRGFVPIWGRFAPSACIQLFAIETLYGMFGFDPI